MLKRYYQRLNNRDQYKEVMARMRRRHRFRVSPNEVIFNAELDEIKYRRMSSMFYRKPAEVKESPGYGFDKRTPQEIKLISDRLSCYSGCSRPLHTPNQMTAASSSPFRVPSGCSRRTPSSMEHLSRQNSANKRMTDKEMQRLLRRLQKPTESYATSTKPDNDAPKRVMSGKSDRSQARQRDEVTEKFVERISRPTTASRAKRFTECYLCYEHEQKKPSDPPDAFDYSYCRDKSAPPEEVDYIVSRMRIPTCSSAYGQRSCRKTPIMIDPIKIRDNLPLVSGLARSKNYKEITDRLHPKSKYRMLPEATPITIYC